MILVRDKLINATPNPNCPCCKKQIKGIPGIMHTKAQWKRYHPASGQSIDPLVKSHK